MAAVRWLVATGRSEEVIITVPDAPVGTGAAADRLKAALEGHSEKKPAWFRLLERLGYWWYPICMVATAVVFALFAPGGLGVDIAYGVGAGVLAALVVSAILTSVANVQARFNSGRHIQETIVEVAPFARRGGGVADLERKGVI